MDLGDLRLVSGSKKSELAGTITLAPPSSLTDLWSRRFPEPMTAFASGWMRVRARARQRGVELPLVISDHADWDGLCETIVATGAGEVWVTHGAEDALVHWCETRQLKARPLHMVGYGDEGEEDAAGAPLVERGESSESQPIPSPLAGEGWGGGSFAHEASADSPPSRRALRGDLPLKGGGDNSGDGSDAEGEA